MSYTLLTVTYDPDTLSAEYVLTDAEGHGVTFHFREQWPVSEIIGFEVRGYTEPGTALAARRLCDALGALMVELGDENNDIDWAQGEPRQSPDTVPTKTPLGALAERLAEKLDPTSSEADICEVVDREAALLGPNARTDLVKRVYNLTRERAEVRPAARRGQ